ncbi:hypothetical protein AL711_01845 [Clostridium botulinum]|nr:hypothetical protein AL711_01845 [Clostridium botulinum]
MLVGIIYYKTRSVVLCMVSHILSNGFTFLYITSNIRNFFIGAVIFIISGILLEKYIEELKCDGTNISSAG